MEQVIIETTGDLRQDSIPTLGVQGVFTKEIQQALLRDEIDIAVHSLKDLPTLPTPGLHLAAITERASAWDVLVSRAGHTLAELPAGAKVGTSSRRRRAQLLAYRSDLEICEIRGNVGTRLSKLDQGQITALVLAQAGLDRLGFVDRPRVELAPPLMLPAAGQGALGLETRADDSTTTQALQLLHHAETAASVRAERAVLSGLRAGCLAPVGTWGRLGDAGQLVVSAVVLSLDGQQVLKGEISGTAEDAEALGLELAQQLIGQGAAELISRASEAPSAGTAT